MTATKSKFKRPANGSEKGDKPRKEELVGARVVVRMREFDPQRETKYGDQAMAAFDLLVLDGEHDGYHEMGRREFGNLAAQIGAALKPGDLAVGRYISGEGNQGRRWFGIEWSEDDSDYDAAEAALASVPT